MSFPITQLPSRSRLTAFVLLAAFFVLTGCATTNGSADKTSLQLQAVQAKQFETSKKVAFSAVMTVFQDLGYTIGTADLETGFITAKSPTKKTGGFLFYYSEHGSISVTAYITPIAENRTKVRLNFVNVTKSSGIYGVVGGSDKPIEDPVVYQNAFSKIQKSIFVIENTEISSK